MRFGASVWPWRWDTPYDKAVKRIGDAGFRATELIAWTRAAIDDYYTPENIKKLRGVLDGEGMVLSQFVVNNSGMASADAATRKARVDMFKAGVDTGVKLGATIINTVTHLPFDIEFPRLQNYPLMQMVSVDLPKELDWNQNWHDYVAAVKECAEYAEQAGVKYSIEPHPFRYGANTEGLLRLLDAVDSPALGINFDPSHLFPVGEIPHMVIYRLAGKIVHCHFSDNDSYTNAHWRPGMGKIDWKAVLQALKDTGYDGVISLEFEDVPGVSRGSSSSQPTAYGHNDDATAGFEAEYKTALSFLTELAEEVGLNVE